MPNFPNFNVNPTGINFGNVTEGSSSGLQNITITNIGSASGSFNINPVDTRFVFTLISTNGTVGPWAGHPGQFIGTLPPGKYATFSVQFNSASPSGVTTSYYFIATTFGGTNYSTNLTLTANAVVGIPAWAVTPNPFSFGSFQIGTTNSRLFTIKNNDASLNLTVNSITPNSGEFTISGAPGLPITLTPGQSATFTVNCTAQFSGNNTYANAVTITPSAGPTINLALSYSGFAIVPAFTLTGATQGVLFGLGGVWGNQPNNIIAQCLASLQCEADASLTKMMDFGNPSEYTYANRLFLRIDPLGSVSVGVDITSEISENFTTALDFKTRAAQSNDSLGIPDVIVFDTEQNGEIHMIVISVAANNGILSIQHIIPAFEPRGSVYESA